MDAQMILGGRFAPLALPQIPPSKFGRNRQTHLIRNEQAAFASVRRAYANLADTPLDSHRLKAARRAVHESREWWACALADLNRSRGWE
jgi:hypothetical protein